MLYKFLIGVLVCDHLFVCFILIVSCSNGFQHIGEESQKIELILQDACTFLFRRDGYKFLRRAINPSSTVSLQTPQGNYGQMGILHRCQKGCNHFFNVPEQFWKQ